MKIAAEIGSGHRVAIVVLNWNGFNDTVECLKSLSKLEYRAYQVVLVDNGSSKEEGKRLKELFPEVHLIQNEKNRGFSGGNNDGINWALENDFEYIVNLNNDCTVERDWLLKLVSGILSEKYDFGSSRVMFWPRTDLICSDGDIMFPDGSAVPENRNKACSAEAHPRPIFSACGAGSIYSVACLRATVVRGNQYFDELYFAYYEDVDLGIRLNMKGYKGVSVPDAVVYHKHSATAGEYSEFKVFHSEKNRMLNELLNYPLYLVPVGESFFLFKLCALFSSFLFKRSGKGARYVKAMGVWTMISTLFRARLWVARNMQEIWRARMEREKEGFVSRKIAAFFSWNIGKTL